MNQIDYLRQESDNMVQECKKQTEFLAERAKLRRNFG